MEEQLEAGTSFSTTLTFEESIHDDILYIVFNYLYPLPLSQTKFYALLVNKRWCSIFDHPLSTFYEGRFNHNLYKHPPSYYYLSTGHRKPWNMIRKSSGMTLQIIRLKEDDEKHEEFVVREMLLHNFVSTLRCENNRINKILKEMNQNGIEVYNTDQLGSKHNFLSDEDYWRATKLNSRDTVWSNGKSILRAHLDRMKESASFCKLVVQNDPVALLLVPTQFLGKEICMLGVRQSDAALPFVPELFKNKEMYELAMQRNETQFKFDTDLSITYYPKEYLTADMVREAVIQKPVCLRYLVKSVPSLLTAEVFKLAITANARTLEFVPLNMRTIELLELAVQTDGQSIQFIEDSSKTKELCRLAIENSGIALQYVPESLRDEELSRKALQNHSRALQFVPDYLKTKELCKIAIQKDTGAYDFVPDRLKTDEEINNLMPSQPQIRRVAINPNHPTINEMYKITTSRAIADAHDARAQEIRELAVQIDGEYLNYIPDFLKTQRLCQLSVEQNGLALREVPKQWITPQLCKTALNSSPLAIFHVPTEMRTIEMYTDCVKRNSISLSCVPTKSRTVEMFVSVVRNDVLALLEVVPIQMRDIVLLELTKK